MISEEEIASMETDASSGSKMINRDGVHVFLSKLKSCVHIGVNFECLTPIKFKCIVYIKKSNDNDEDDDLQKKRENHTRASSWKKVMHW